jgi:hypothetical protein
MQTIKTQIISIILLSIVLILSLNIHAQKNTNKKQVFLRVYNLEGKKISKGRVVFINDSILALKAINQNLEIKVEHIGFIKTKKSGGHNVLIGALTGAALGALSGATLFEPSPPDALIFSLSREDNATIGLIIGAAAGTAVGGATILAKKSKTFIINGDYSKWNDFREIMSKME